MTEKDLPHDMHDRGIKHLLSYWKIFQQLMQGYTKENWVNRLDYQKSKRIERSFILKEYQKKESDVLYSVPLLESDREIYLYVLIEHQSSVDFSMPFRVLFYLVSLWMEIYKNTEQNLRTQKGFRLPPVFPIVLYNGKNSWTAATSVKEIVEYGELFTDFIPNLKYHLIDIPRLDIDKLKQIGNALAGVFILEHEISSEEFEKAFHDALDLIDKEHDDEIWKGILEWIRMRLLGNHPKKAEKLFQEIDFSKHNRKEIKTMLETMPRKLIAYGHKKGKIEGKAEGKIEGKAEGKIEGKAEGKAEGKVEGKIEGKQEIAIEMLKDHVDIKQIVKFTKLSEKEVLKLKKEL